MYQISVLAQFSEFEVPVTTRDNIVRVSMNLGRVNRLTIGLFFSYFCYLIFFILFYYYFLLLLFSEYRAELYTRLENRRMRKLTRENRKAESNKHTSQPLKERKVHRMENTLNEFNCRELND